MAGPWLQIKDNAEGLLDGALLAAATSIVLQAGGGAKFPSSGNFVVTIENEKILCDGRTGDTISIETRGYDSTIASDHTHNTKVELRVISEHMTEIRNRIETAEGDITTNAGDISDVAGDLSTHSSDASVHWKDHDHSASGAQGGSLSTSSLVSGETPGGTINGSNTAFTTASAYTAGSLKVYKNGIRLKGGGNDYTEVAQGFTMVTAPVTGTVLVVDYNTVPSVFNTGSTSFIYSELCGGTPNGVLTAFTTSSSYVSLSTVVFLDGVRMRRGVDYTESADKQITFSSAPLTGSEILIDYQSAVSVAGNADTLDGKHLADMWPVGSVYISVNNVNPATMFGFGTWVSIAAGQTLVGVDTNQTEFNTVKKTGGSKVHKHRANGNETGMAAGVMRAQVGCANGEANRYAFIATDANDPNNGATANYTYATYGSGVAANGGFAHYVPVVGYSAEQTTLQPYITTYFWERTA